VAVVIGVLALVPAAAPAQDSAAASLPPVERAYRAGRVYAAALAYFAHWPDAPDPKAIDAAYRAYLEAVLASEDRVSFTRASMRFLASFRNGHTLFFDSVLAEQRSRLPFLARPLAGRWSSPKAPPPSCAQATSSRRSTAGRSRTSSASCGP
jgi:hypothetical protein